MTHTYIFLSYGISHAIVTDDYILCTLITNSITPGSGSRRTLSVKPMHQPQYLDRWILQSINIKSIKSMKYLAFVWMWPISRIAHHYHSTKFFAATSSVSLLPHSSVWPWPAYKPGSGEYREEQWQQWQQRQPNSAAPSQTISALPNESNLQAGAWLLPKFWRFRNREQPRCMVRGGD